VITQEYRRNRSQFPAAEVAQYQGTWVAFSADGRRIVASEATLERLEESLATSGADPQAVVLEWVAGPDDDTLLGGGDLV
jgi:hypothetical protein